MNSDKVLDSTDVDETVDKGIFGLKFISQEQISNVVKIWLCIGIFMVFMQVVIGGITRLTGSGLSMKTP